MPDRWQSRLRIQSEPEAAHNANLFRQTLFADQHHDYGHLYIRMCCKRVGKIRVHRVDRERRCVRQQVVMLILQLRFIRRRQISLGKKNLRNGWAAVGMGDNPHVDPDGHRPVAQFARFKLLLLHGGDGGLIECPTVLVQNLNMCRGPVKVNDHRKHGHPL